MFDCVSHCLRQIPCAGRSWLVLAAVLVLIVSSGDAGEAAESAPPNLVLILCDNLGYGDVGCFGSTLHRTPHLDRMAAEGMRLTDFYVASGVCTPSRAAIMTGCYPRRVNLHVSDTNGLVLQPVSPKGLHPDERTLAEILKDAGYATACIGKWHLGDQPEFLPTRQGFDEYLGIPYSDDMTPREGKPWPPLPLLKGEEVIEAGVDRNLLTRRYTEASIEFIEEHQDEPFFLYLPHAMPGSTREPFASDRFRGKSANGAYGDSVEELDWSTGEILSALERLGLDEKTLVIWTSDNGAPRRNPPQGINIPLRGWGYDTSEGAMRVPAIVRWPGHVPQGVSCSELCTAMDLLPTFAALAGAALPEGTQLDGRNIWPLLSGHPEASSPHEAFYYYAGTQLQAVRSGDWKLYLAVETLPGSRRPPMKETPALFNLATDLAEETNLVSSHPQVVKRLMTLAESARKDLGDADREGVGQRPAGWVDHVTPRVPSE